MSVLSVDILTIIATYISPNPIVYTNLAAVSRDFYSVFTRDSIWCYLDVYTAGKDIFQSFKDHTREEHDRGLIKFFWTYTGTYNSSEPLSAITENKFAWLGYLASKHSQATKKVSIDNVNDEQLITCLLNIAPRNYGYSNDDSEKNVNAAVTAMKTSSTIYEELPRCVKNNCDFQKAIIWIHPGLQCKFGDEMRGAINSRTDFLKKLGTLPDIFELFPEYHDDYEAILTVIWAGQPLRALRLASDRRKDDRELITMAIKINVYAIKYASNRLQQDCELQRLCANRITKHLEWEHLKDLWPWVMDNRDTMLNIVECVDGKCLASSRALLSSREFCLDAVQRHYTAFEQVPSEFTKDKSFIYEAISRNWCCYRYLRHLPSLIREDPDLFKLAMTTEDRRTEISKKSSRKIAFADIRNIISKDLELLKLAFTRERVDLNFVENPIPKRFRGDEGVAMAAVEFNPELLKTLGKQFKSSKVVVSAAFKNYSPTYPKGDLFQYIGNDLLGDNEFISPYIRKYGTFKVDLLENRQYAVWSLSIHKSIYTALPDKYKVDVGLILEALKQNMGLFSELDNKLRGNKIIQSALVDSKGARLVNV